MSNENDKPLDQAVQQGQDAAPQQASAPEARPPRAGGPGGPGGPGGDRGQRRGPGGGPGQGRGQGRGPGGGPGQGRGPGPGQADDAERSEWKEKVIQIRRVTKVVKGGKKMSFRAVVVVGNGKGQVGIGIGKSNEVIGAIQKGVAAAKKSLIDVPLHNTTIPHPVKSKAGGSVVVLRPASKGTGVIAGGAARALLELAGIENILSKSLGSNSPLNVARATLKGLAELRTFEQIARARGKTVKEILM
ncbi:30S ribosomal protein S5 [Vampirovibrio sp.]|uniref:30S ribosomal protein S5 n=1 Tax=Vampirovibrio sp. TaxID=2717857 RepID=UPI003593232C